MKKVIVVMGGYSSEREVSLVSGENVIKALQNIGYDVIPHDLTDGYKFAQALYEHRPDVVFNALHGNFGEDGSIQGFLDIMQIPYTHSSVEASAIGMNKALTKEIAQKVGIKVADDQIMTWQKFKDEGTKIPMPFVIKPVSEGSSVGVFIVHDPSDLTRVNYDNPEVELIIESYIPGRELTAMCLNGKSYVVTELKPKHGFYDYKNKYTNGMTEHILPADIPESVAKKCKDYAEKIHNALGCNTVSRSDFRYNENDDVVFLEINTNPGFTALSLVPEQAKYIGTSYEDLCKILVENATCKKL